MDSCVVCYFWVYLYYFGKGKLGRGWVIDSVNKLVLNVEQERIHLEVMGHGEVDDGWMVEVTESVRERRVF